MSVAVITGSAGLIGAEAARHFTDKGLTVVGIDNDMRRQFFGEDASTRWARNFLETTLPGYRHVDADIRDENAMRGVFATYKNDIAVVIHTAAQPSHDWAASDPVMDFTVNANGTLNCCELAAGSLPRGSLHVPQHQQGLWRYAEPAASGRARDALGGRGEHAFAEHGIDETMSIDQTTHSLFGVSKAAADLMVQEFGRYFGMKTACFRGGCLTGSGHSGAPLHGFLSYLMKCAVERTALYRAWLQGQAGARQHPQLRSGQRALAFLPKSAQRRGLQHGRQPPRQLLGPRGHRLCEEITGRPMSWKVDDKARTGDHIWWISDVRRFQSHYPHWRYTYDLRSTLEEIHDAMQERAQSRRRGLMLASPSRHDWVAAGVPGMLSVVIPAHNEPENLRAVVPVLLTALPDDAILHEIRRRRRPQRRRQREPVDCAERQPQRTLHRQSTAEWIWAGRAGGLGHFVGMRCHRDGRWLRRSG